MRCKKIQNITKILRRSVLRSYFRESTFKGILFLPYCVHGSDSFAATSMFLYSRTSNSHEWIYFLFVANRRWYLKIINYSANFIRLYFKIVTVGISSFLRCSAHLILSLMSVLLGSTRWANFKFCKVYSCPQYTCVESGRLPNLSIKAECICSAVPSKNRPQPATNKVSPVVNNENVYYFK